MSLRVVLTLKMSLMSTIMISHQAAKITSIASAGQRAQARKARQSALFPHAIMITSARSSVTSRSIFRKKPCLKTSSPSVFPCNMKEVTGVEDSAVEMADAGEDMANAAGVKADIAEGRVLAAGTGEVVGMAVHGTAALVKAAAIARAQVEDLEAAGMAAGVKAAVETGPDPAAMVAHDVLKAGDQCTRGDINSALQQESSPSATHSLKPLRPQRFLLDRLECQKYP